MVHKSTESNGTFYIKDLSSDRGSCEDVWGILKEVDAEFVPPLSSRNSPRDVTLYNSSKVVNDCEPTRYFKEMLKQRTIVVKINGKVAGFLSYRENYLVPEIKEARAAYVSTIAISRRYRGKGLAKSLYKFLIERVSQNPENPHSISTRTWSTNQAHINLILNLGFCLVASVKDGRGKGIDTVVYALDL